jgi:23S rRNA pseudouridine1911/1915/1917 synthase
MVRRSRELHVVYEDDALMAIDKPAGLLTVPLERRPGRASVLGMLRERFRSRGRQRRIFVVHRIDQDTSGLVVFAKDEATQHALIHQFRRREPERVYLAIVRGVPQPPEDTWRDRIVWDRKALIQKRARAADRDAEEAISNYRVAEELGDAALLEVRLQTGRRNQIRIQAALHGHPLLGDRRYADETVVGTIRFGRQALHAWRLTFRHPTDGRELRLESDPPPDFADLLARLRARRRGQTRV